MTPYQQLRAGLDIQNGNRDSILARIDLLNELGISDPMADLLRANVYDDAGKKRASEHYYKRSYEGWTDPPEDWDAYLASAYGLSTLRMLRGELEGALTVLTEALDKESALNGSESLRRSALLSTLAQCQQGLNRPEQLLEAQMESYDILLKHRGEPGTDVNIIISTCNIAEYYLDGNDLANARIWTDRLEKEMKDYAPHAEPQLYKEYMGALLLNKVVLLQKTGQQKRAALLFDSIPREDLMFNFSIGKVADYLMSAGRYGEAADWLALLEDNVYSDDGAKMNLDNIATRLTPRYFATLKAGRTQEALAISTQICEAIDSALVWERTNLATELAIAYETAHKEQLWQEKMTQVKTLKIVILGLILLLTVVAVALREIISVHRMLGRKNQDLYETTRQLSDREEADFRTLQEEPEERLNARQKLFRRICVLMREQAPYTDCTLKREDLARMLATNYNNVAEAIRECTGGQSLGEYLDGLRLKHAARLLASQDDPIGLITEMSGFQSRAHFNTLFREKYKMTPSEYRKVVHEL